MKNVSVKSLVLGTAVASFALLSGCASNLFPGGPSVHGVLVTNVTSPAQNLTVATDGAVVASKTGSASSTAILGLIATGDSSVQAAMKAGNITKVHNVDHTVNSFIYGAFIRHTINVHGE